MVVAVRSAGKGPTGLAERTAIRSSAWTPRGSLTHVGLLFARARPRLPRNLRWTVKEAHDPHLPPGPRRKVNWDRKEPRTPRRRGMLTPLRETTGAHHRR